MNKIQISLAAARVNAGMTQDEVSKRLHIGKQTIVNWESGKTEPSISQSRQLSELYQMPLECIFFGK